MPIRRENHPFSALAQQIENLVCASLVLTSILAAAALLNTGRLSIFVVPALVIPTLIHGITLIILASRDRRRTAAELKGTLAPSARRPALVVAWGLSVLWVCAAAVIVVVVAMAHLDTWGRRGACLELPLALAEAAVLAMLAVKCGKQRRRTIVRPQSVDWRNFGAPLSARV